MVEEGGEVGGPRLELLDAVEVVTLAVRLQQTPQRCTSVIFFQVMNLNDIVLTSPLQNMCRMASVHYLLLV